MSVKLLLSFAGPIVRWTAKEISNNPFVREYLKARILGAPGHVAYQQAQRAAGHAPAQAQQTSRRVCPLCGAPSRESPLYEAESPDLN